MKSEQNFSVIKQDGTIIDMHEIGVWVESFHIHSPNIYRNKLKIPNMPGAYLANSTEEERKVSIVMQLESENLKEFDQLKHQIYDVFFSEEDFTIIRDLTPDREIHVLQEGDFDIANITPSDGYFEIELTMLDPYVYSKEKSAIFPSDAVTLTNHGTAEADPIFEMEVLQPVTFAMIQNHKEEYQMIGRPASVSSEIVDTRTLLLREDGSTLDSWSTNPTAVDGTVSGHLSTDGAGITVPNYGSGPEWHGPALIKEVPLTQDFEVDMRVQGRTFNPRATFRIEFYLFDESMNVLGKMAVNDSSRSTHQIRAEGRVGPFVGRGINYLISSKNYQYNWDHFFGMIRMRRIGKRFEFYVSRVANDGARHTRTLEQIYTDNAGEFQGRLKYIQIHIGKFSGTPNAYAPKIYSVKVYKLTEVTVDQTPYIARPGDIITFDHKDNEILINGEDRKDLKDFGGRFFKLAKGANQLIVQPSDSFSTSVKYREKFR